MVENAARLPRRPSGPIVVVANAGSGSKEVDDGCSAIESVLRDARRDFRIDAVADPGRLRAAAQRAVSEAAASDGIVVAAGGDGTINAVAQAALGQACAFGVIPRGTFNFFSRAHGIPLDATEATQMLLATDAHPVQVGLVNGRIFLVNASVGLYPQLLADREAWKQRYGRKRFVALGAALATLLRGHLQLRLQIEHDGRTRSRRTPTVFVGNNRLQLEQVGIDEAALVDSGALVAVMPRPVGSWSLLWLAVRGAFGTLGDADQVETFGFRKLNISPSRRGRQRFDVAVDGEVFRLDAPLRFTVAPEPLHVMLPDPT